MADGKTHVLYHNKFWIPALVISALTSLIFFKLDFLKVFLYNIFFVIFYWMGENIISCDLDQILVGSQDGRLIMAGKNLADKIKKGNRLVKLFGFFIGLPTFLFSQWSAFYAYTMEFVGGHRNFWSHSIIVSTIIRMAWFDIILVFILNLLYSFGITHWGWTSNYIWELFLDIWALPCALAQFTAWSITDAIHLFLDTDYVKGRLYIPNKK